VLDSILQLSADSALRIGDDEAAIRCLVELLAPGMSALLSIDPFELTLCLTDSKITVEERASYAASLQEVLTVRSVDGCGRCLTLTHVFAQTRTPSSFDKARIVIDMNEVAPLCERARRSLTFKLGAETSFSASRLRSRLLEAFKRYWALCSLPTRPHLPTVRSLLRSRLLPARASLQRRPAAYHHLARRIYRPFKCDDRLRATRRCRRRLADPEPGSLGGSLLD
jgi:hypothetical protein